MKILALCFLILAFGTAVFAQPDPRDSIILESKTVKAGAHSGGSTDTAAYVYLKVYITNKDTLTAISLSVQEYSTSGGAYMTLGRPRNFNGTVSRLTNTLNGSLVFFGARYHSNSPDSFFVAGVFDPLVPSTHEPPNAVRKAFWEFKFDTVISYTGTLEIDTVRTTSSTGFTNTVPRDVPVNFVKSRVEVRGGMNFDPRDSVILESKAVNPGAHNGSATDTSAFVYLKVYLTNKDSLGAIQLSLKETSLSGGGLYDIGPSTKL